MRTAEEWSQVQIPERVSFVLGWRTGTTLRAGRLRLHRSMDREFRGHAETALSDIGRRIPRSYEPTVHLEEDEVFLLTTNDLPDHAMRPATRHRRTTPRAAPQVAIASGPHDRPIDLTVDDRPRELSALLSYVRDPDALEELTFDRVRGRRFLFYSVVFADHGKSLAFIKRYNPASVLNAGLIIGLFGQTIRRLDRPGLVFEHDFDLIIDGEELAALSPDAIVRLFTDVEVSAAGVPTLVGQLRQTSLGFSPASLEVIEAACAGRRLLARRLATLLEQPHIGKLKPRDVEEYLIELDEEVERYVVDGELVATKETVGDLLDVLGQLHYRSGYERELRRADRSSRV